VVSNTFDATQGDDPLVAGLARLAGINSARLPVGGALAAGNNTLVDLRNAEREFMRGNVAGWREALETLETRWFSQIIDWLRSGRIGKAVIATVADSRRHEWSVMRAARWQIWKRPRPLTHHARDVLRQRDSSRLA
jgi:hypothetical protein